MRMFRCGQYQTDVPNRAYPWPCQTKIHRGWRLTVHRAVGTRIPRTDVVYVLICYDETQPSSTCFLFTFFVRRNARKLRNDNLQPVHLGLSTTTSLQMIPLNERQTKTKDIINRTFRVLHLSSSFNKTLHSPKESLRSRIILMLKHLRLLWPALGHHLSFRHSFLLIPTTSRPRSQRSWS